MTLGRDPNPDGRFDVSDVNAETEAWRGLRAHDQMLADILESVEHGIAEARRITALRAEQYARTEPTLEEQRYEDLVQL